MSVMEERLVLESKPLQCHRQHGPKVFTIAPTAVARLPLFETSSWKPATPEHALAPADLRKCGKTYEGPPHGDR